MAPKGHRRRRGKRSNALMKALPPDILQYISTFIGETKFRYLANVRYSWLTGHGIDKLWLKIEWAAPHGSRPTFGLNWQNAHHLPNAHHHESLVVWKKMSTGTGLNFELPNQTPLKQIKHVHNYLAQYKFILKALSLPHQLFNALPDGPNFSPASMFWRVDADGRWHRNRFLNSPHYIPHFKPL